MRRSMQIIGLWVSTAFRAAPGLTTLICVSMVLSSATAPLQVLGVKLLIDALVAQTSPTTGLVLLVACLAGGAVANAVRRPIGDTLDERINAHVQDDLVRLTTAIPSIAHHEDPQLADRISILHDGRIIADGTLADLKRLLPPAKVEYVEKQPTLEQIFLSIVTPEEHS